MSHDNGTETPAIANPFATLRRFVRAEAPQERCELCSAGLAEEHQHLFAPENRQLLCACDACALLFDNPAASKYRRVPRRARYLPEFHLSDVQWDAMLIPVGMAFFTFNSAEQRMMAVYPSPAGATESLLHLESWQEIVSENPVLETMQPDVEALLINRLVAARDYYIVPIDKCFELVGLMRMHWRGLSDGVRVADFGIRGFDLAYAMMDGYDVTIMVDAMPRGEAPGTLFILEANLDELNENAEMDAHGMNPVQVLQLVRSLGGEPGRVLVVGCEPATFGPENIGQMGLSEAVQAAVDEGVRMVEELVLALTPGPSPNPLRGRGEMKVKT